MDQLSPEQKQELREVFNFFDKENKGSLTTKEFTVLMRAVGEDLNESQVSGMCPGGSITYDAFERNRAEKWAAQQAGDVVKHAFRVLDREGNGYVTAYDLRRLLTSLGQPLSPAEVEELIRDAGGGEQINYSEFVDKMMRKKN
ncbi:Calcium-binding protein 8 [Balamuthia mandrillaris]